MNQVTSKIIMIRPKHFNYNVETADNNFFQKKINSVSSTDIKRKSISEFNRLVKALKRKKITVEIFEDSEDIITTDSVFPNNWFSLHKNGNFYLYPMFSKNRRKERRKDIIQHIKDKYNVKQIVDLSHYEKENKFLEGTGSMVLDRENRICYASISERTNSEILHIFCKHLGYEPVTFKAYQKVNDSLEEIYHTNVIMSIGINYVIICLQCINSKKERKFIIDKITSTGKTLIEISEYQLNNFAGNMLQVENENGKKFLIMSKKAYESLEDNQIKLIESYNEIIYSDLSIIETLGGGSARCMIAENFLEKK